MAQGPRRGCLQKMTACRCWQCERVVVGQHISIPRVDAELKANGWKRLTIEGEKYPRWVCPTCSPLFRLKEKPTHAHASE